MTLFTKKFVLAALLCAGAAGSAFAAETVEIVVTHENGSFTKTNAAGNWAQEWTSTATEPSLIIDVAANNIAVSGTGDLVISSGQSGTFTMTFSTDDGWRVSKYEVTLSTTTSYTYTIEHHGTSESLTSAAPLSIVEEFTADETPTIKQTGNNSEVIYGNFTVTLVKIDTEDPVEVEDDPCLEVDAEPAGDKIGDLVQTNIVDDHFNTFTTWYNLLDGDNFLGGTSATVSATKAQVQLNNDEAYADELLYCVVDGTLYNKAGGIATPVSGAVVNASGVTINGNAVTVNFAQKFCPVTVSGGTITRADGSTTSDTWQGTWTSNYEPTVSFYCAYNNMTVNNGEFQIERGSSGGTWCFAATGTNYVADYTFLAKKNGSYTNETTLTPVNGTGVTLTEYYQRINGSGYNGETSMSNFAQAGTNGSGAIITDVYVTVRRSYARVNEREGYVIYKRGSIERRIPAIARVYKGDHAGRLITIYDYRHNGGDIGGGNISLQISVSDDNGASWSEPDYLKDAVGNYVTTHPDSLDKSTSGRWSEFQADNNTYWQAAYGDAALCADRESGKVLMMAVGGTLNFFNGRYANPNQCVRWYSEDGGETWTEPQRVTYDILDLFNGEPTYGYIDSQFIASGRIMQSRYIKVGDYYRIYCVIGSQNSGGNTRNFMLYSDDFGQNWQVLGGADQCPVSTGAGDECKAEELPDGSVILAGRNRSANRNFNIFRYTDVTKGEGTWTGHVITNMGFGSINACNGEIMVLPAVCNDDNTDCYLILQSFPYGGGRNFVSIAWQGIKDGADMLDANLFTSWEGRYRIASGASVYSTMAWQANDKLAFFWEDTNTDGTYLDLDIEEITGGQYSYKVDDQNKTAIRLTKELIDERMKEDFGANEGDYVGMYIKGNAQAIENAASSYQTTPSYNTYVKFNKLIYNGQTVPVVDNGGYMFVSAHNGAYSFTQDLILDHNGTKLITNEEDSDNSIWTVEPTENEGYYLLHNLAADVYIGNLASGTNTDVPVVTDKSEAGEYMFISQTCGFTAISNLNPGAAARPAIHMASGTNVVPWTNGAAASQWYMELIDEPEGYESSAFTDPEYDDYEFNYELNIPQSEVVTDVIREVAAPVSEEQYFDLQGRRIAKPSHGLYITNTGRKVIL